MVVAHRFAPVREREVAVERSSFAKRNRGLVELKAVQRFHAFEKFRLRGRCTGSLERDGAELLRVRGRHREHAGAQECGVAKANSHAGSPAHAP
jgi:hypothetical protein